jgi:chromosome partitioning protein
MIISLLNQKGGVGKTTLTINLAHSISVHDKTKKVLVIDADPQATSLNWYETRDIKCPFDIYSLCSRHIHRDIGALSKGYDFVFIDGPPRVNDITKSCMKASNMIILPCTPSPYDVWASTETIELYNNIYEEEDEVMLVFAINRKIANTCISIDALESIKDLNIPVAESSISQRVTFPTAAAKGLTIFEHEPKGKASQEIMALTEELFFN